MAGDPRSEAELGELLVLLAHDLKNPLAAVVTNLAFVASGLRDIGAPEDMGEALVDARLACDALQRILGNLELLARDSAQTGSAPPPDPTPLDLAAVADEIAGRQRESASTRRLRLSVQLRDAHRHARADRDMVLRAVENLVANAVQHAPPGSEILLEVGGCPGEPREVELVVIDRGPPVGEEVRDAVLTPLGQARSKGRPDGRYGRGLSLYAAALAARASGGRVRVSARDGKSVLSLALPEHDERVSTV